MASPVGELVALSLQVANLLAGNLERGTCVAELGTYWRHGGLDERHQRGGD